METMGLGAHGNQLIIIVVQKNYTIIGISVHFTNIGARPH